MGRRKRRRDSKDKRHPKHRFKVRRQALAILGYSSYDEYLKSAVWANMRQKALARDSYKCQLCGQKAHAVHHITYHAYVLRGEDLSQLISVCNRCHQFIECDGEIKLITTNAIAKRCRDRRKKYKLPYSHKLNPACGVCRSNSPRLGKYDCCYECRKSGKAAINSTRVRSMANAARRKPRKPWRGAYKPTPPPRRNVQPELSLKERYANVATAQIEQCSRRHVTPGDGILESRRAVPHAELAR